MSAWAFRFGNRPASYITLPVSIANSRSSPAPPGLVPKFEFGNAHAFETLFRPKRESRIAAHQVNRTLNTTPRPAILFPMSSDVQEIEQAIRSLPRPQIE